MTFQKCLVCLFPLLLMIKPLPAQTSVKQGFSMMNDGTKLFYSIKGTEGDTIIFLHGGPGQNMYGVEPDLEKLAEQNVLLAYDQRACGKSESGVMEVTASLHIEDLETLRKNFNIQHLNLMGQSWGCMLAVLYTSKYPAHVRKMILVSPGPPNKKLFDQRFQHFLKIDSFGQSVVARLRATLDGESALSACMEIHAINERFYFYNDRKIATRKGDYCDIPAAAVRMQVIGGRSTLASLGNYDLRDLALTIRVPIMIIEGKHSPVPIEEIKTWKEMLPNAYVYIFPKSGHGFPFVEERKNFFKKVHSFLKGKIPAGYTSHF